MRQALQARSRAECPRILKATITRHVGRLAAEEPDAVVEVLTVGARLTFGQSHIFGAALPAAGGFSVSHVFTLKYSLHPAAEQSGHGSVTGRDTAQPTLTRRVSPHLPHLGGAVSGCAAFR